MNRFGAPKMDKVQGELQMDHFLLLATDARLADVTVDDLVKRHHVDRRVAEYKLTIARQNRRKSA